MVTKMEMGQSITITAFYKFVSLPNFKELHPKILDFCKEQQIKGTILLSQEGINATISGLDHNIHAVLNFLKSHNEFTDLNYKIAYNTCHPFLRLKVRLKKEIVTLGIPNINPTIQVGEYIEPTDWNQLISDPDVITIDTRNKYETQIGIFKNAIDPQTNSFREFPEYVTKNFNNVDQNKKIAMYCTGGIRCEKSTAYLLQLGFKNVYHLKGGILNYLEKIPKEHSLWHGECFVFDTRIGVDHNINKGNHNMCYGCRYPISTEDQQSSKYKAGVHCPHCFNRITEKTLKRAEARQKQILLAKKREYSCMQHQK
ncbi:MAG: rhodanese-related sulfurtransferase [Gammaproteobacteria bacterium]